MFFMIHATYAAGHEALWRQHLKAHVEYLRQNVHVVLGAGGLLNDEGDRTRGALYIVEAEDREQARKFIEADPFVASGVVETINIVRWRKSFFDFRHVGGPGHDSEALRS
jgi:uncharacterized protein YciI